MKTLPKVVTRRAKRVGRGAGSGKGFHTVGRGQKGQKSRGKIGILFEGLKMRKSLLRRLPLQRGKGKFKAQSKPLIVDLSLLNLLKDGQKVTVETLIKAGIVEAKEAKQFGVKILGNAKLTKKLSVSVLTSKGAAQKIKDAGGDVSLS